MIVYVPTPITSVEQAEALPEGTIIIHAENYPQEKFAGLWGRKGNSSASLAEEEGWSALVPVEAKEETHSIQTRGQTAPEWRTRLVTPWDVLDDRP